MFSLVLAGMLTISDTIPDTIPVFTIPKDDVLVQWKKPIIILQGDKNVKPDCKENQGNGKPLEEEGEE